MMPPTSSLQARSGSFSLFDPAQSGSELKQSVFARVEGAQTLPELFWKVMQPVQNTTSAPGYAFPDDEPAEPTIAPIGPDGAQVLFPDAHTIFLPPGEVPEYIRQMLIDGESGAMLVRTPNDPAAVGKQVPQKLVPYLTDGRGSHLANAEVERALTSGQMRLLAGPDSGYPDLLVLDVPGQNDGTPQKKAVLLRGPLTSEIIYTGSAIAPDNVTAGNALWDKITLYEEQYAAKFWEGLIPFGRWYGDSDAKRQVIANLKAAGYSDAQIEILLPKIAAGVEIGLAAISGSTDVVDGHEYSTAEHIIGAVQFASVVIPAGRGLAGLSTGLAERTLAMEIAAAANRTGVAGGGALDQLLARDLFVASRGLTMPGSPQRLAATAAELESLYADLLETASSRTFVTRATALGFTEEQIAQLPGRLSTYYKNGQLGLITSGGYIDEANLLIGTQGFFGPSARMRHELGHLLDEIAHPGLFARAAVPGTFGFAGYFDAEMNAVGLQMGTVNPLRPYVASVIAVDSRFGRAAALTYVGGTIVVVYEIGQSLR